MDKQLLREAQVTQYDQACVRNRWRGFVLGKGITAASLGRLLKSRGYKVTMQKADPYLNVDPGTMSPFQHGEVFVTEDGYESDLTWVITSALLMRT